MVDRSHKPGPLAATPTFPPQATVTASEDRVTARLPSGESVEILLFGATVISWKTAAGAEKLWLSDAAKLDGSKPVRGGIPLVFPVFGSPADHSATASLPSHGFARATQWAFLSRGADGDSAESVRLDFGLSSASLDDATRSKWPYAFDLVYSVTLEREGLTTSLVVNNKEETEWFEVQALFHSYFRVDDIANVSITGLEGSPFTDKVNPPAEKTQSSDPITFSGEMDSVYRPELPVAATSDAAATATAAAAPVVVSEAGEPVFSLTRDNLEDVVVWNPWEAKSAGMGDFEPKDGWKRMVCVEAGSVRAWQRLEAGDSWSISQTISL